MANRTLVDWIGHTDLVSMVQAADEKIAVKVEAAINRQLLPSDDGGPD